jgi:phenylacetate-coenzyme A ligase PaaK-like adenylate-forming protein
MLTDIEQTLGSIRELRSGGLEYVVIRPANGGADEPLRLQVEVGEAQPGDKDTLRALVQKAFDERIGIRVDPEILDRDSLPRAGYKATRIVDEPVN